MGFLPIGGKPFFWPVLQQANRKRLHVHHAIRTTLLKGLTRAGKIIEPLAVSASPGRYSDSRKVEKWFRRNCNSVLGRACSAVEKGDFITFMQTQ